MNKFIKSLFLALAFSLFTVTAVNATGAGTSVTTTKENTKQEDFCGVYPDQIICYLKSFGYDVQKLTPVTGSCDVIATTQYSYRTIVHIVDGQIIDHQDIDI